MSVQSWQTVFVRSVGQNLCRDAGKVRFVEAKLAEGCNEPVGKVLQLTAICVQLSKSFEVE